MAYAKDARSGVIQTPAGDHYLFHKTDWLSATEPQRDMRVHFTCQDKCAVNVSLLLQDGERPLQKSLP